MTGKTILIVDDEKRMLEMLETRLSSAGYQVVQARDGEEGVEQAKKYLPDLILMDIMMPKMDGSQAVGWLQKDPKTKNIPVIFLTAIITKEEEKEQAFGIQLDVSKYRFIAKPFDTVSLLSEIETVLSE